MSFNNTQTVKMEFYLFFVPIEQHSFLSINQTLSDRLTHIPNDDLDMLLFFQQYLITSFRQSIVYMRTVEKTLF